MKNDKTISELPDPRLVLIDPTPRLVSPESNMFTVIKAVVPGSADTTNFANAWEPFLKDDMGLPCWSVACRDKIVKLDDCDLTTKEPVSFSVLPSTKEVDTI